MIKPSDDESETASDPVATGDASVTTEPAWMEAVHERDRLFGLPPTTYEATALWASIVVMCPKKPALHAVYRVPAYLEAEVTAYAKLDGWHETSAGMICPACAKKAGAS